MLQAEAENVTVRSDAENALLRSTDGDVEIQENNVEEGIGWKTAKEKPAEKKLAEVEAVEEGAVESDEQLQEAFGNSLRFPTHRQPAECDTGVVSYSECLGNQR